MTKFTVVQSLLVNFCVLLVLGFSYLSGQATTSKNVICSYHHFSKFESAATPISTSVIDPSICTHLEYFYIEANGGSLLASGGLSDHSKELKEFQNLSLSNPSLKVILAVMDASYPSTVSKSYEDRQIFINNIIDFLQTWDFDGIDLQWIKTITQEFVTFIKEMRAAFMAEATSSGKEPLILMVSVPGWGAFTEGVDIQPLGQIVDILHTSINGYRLKPKGRHPSKSTTFDSPMYGNGGYYGNVSASITDYLDAGIPPEIMHIGITLLATTYRLLDSGDTGVGAPAKRVGEPGEYTKKTGHVAYYEVCKRLQEEGYTAELDPEGLVSFAYKGDQWMTYEDPASLEIKMNYVHDHNLGGVVAMFVHQDDYTGQFCNQGPYPQISTLYRFATRNITTTTTSPTTTPQPQTCSSSIVNLPDPDSCEHYRICVFSKLFRSKCPRGLSFDSEKGYCVENPTATCVTIPEPC